jgi:hypothetical protein
MAQLGALLQLVRHLSLFVGRKLAIEISAQPFVIA